MQLNEDVEFLKENFRTELKKGIEKVQEEYQDMVDRLKLALDISTEKNEKLNLEIVGLKQTNDNSTSLLNRIQSSLDLWNKKNQNVPDNTDYPMVIVYT